MRPATTQVSRIASSSFTQVWYIFHELTLVASALLAFNCDAFHNRNAHTFGFVSRYIQMFCINQSE